MDKLEYISRMLTKISHKRLECYVIYRIWNGLNRTDVRFDFQQYVRRKDGNYALADLYLPQFKISVEVNEPAHYYNMAEDLKRRSEVSAHGLKVLNIDCYNVINGKSVECSLEELNYRTDQVVLEIRTELEKRIASNSFIPWTMQDIVTVIKNRGVLRVEDYISINTIDEIAEIFGAKLKHRGYLRAGGADIPNKTGWTAWWPNTKNPVWTNIVNPEETEIREFKNDGGSKFLEDNMNQDIKKVTFIKDRDWLGNESYRFIGVFELDKEKSSSEGKCVWRKFSDEYIL